MGKARRTGYGPPHITSLTCRKKLCAANRLAYQGTPTAAECLPCRVCTELHITMRVLLGVKMLSIFHPRRTQCWKVISNSTTPCNDSVPNQRAATWTILPRCFIQKGTAYGLGRHTCVRLRIWGYG